MKRWYEPYRVGSVGCIVADDEPVPLEIQAILCLYEGTKIIHPQIDRPATHYVVPVNLA